MRITRILLAVICTALFTFGCSEPKEAVVEYDGLPPGYILVTNQNGEWRSAYENPFVVCTPYPHEADGSRNHAVRRAWGQYNFDEELKRQVWHKAQ
jgi:hypothetical protein